ncbi:MAG: M67 family metallopeptidase [Actinobacteria bacterium]|nr:M67 family metallopeptidase [Actinomycetota bacterium]
MIEHARREFPKEACGLLGGPRGTIEAIYPMRNADDSAVTYRLDPTEQLRVFREIEDRGWDLIAIYHSHTHSEAYPSVTDRRLAFYPEAVYVLVSLAAPEDPVVRAFSIRDGDVDELEVTVS